MADVEITTSLPAVVEIVGADDLPVSVDARQPAVVEVLTVGLQGPAGSAPTRIDAPPAATWVLPHTLGHVPMVQVYLVGGEFVLADVSADASVVNVMFAEPQSGFVLIA